MPNPVFVNDTCRFLCVQVLSSPCGWNFTAKQLYYIYILYVHAVLCYAVKGNTCKEYSVQVEFNAIYPLRDNVFASMSMQVFTIYEI